LNYNERVQNLEKTIKELDDELKILTARREENMDTAVRLVNDEVDNLNSIGTQLNSQTSKKDASILEKQIQFSIEKMKNIFFMHKKIMHLHLESLRLHSNIIRKISPDTSDLLNSRIDESEALSIQLIKNYDQWQKKGYDENDKERNELTKELFDKINTVESEIIISRNCIRDTLNKIKSK